MKTIEQILSQVPDKRDDKDTTSHVFKKDVYDFFREDKWRERSIIEVSCNKGYSSYLLSHLFKQVYAVDFVQKALNWAGKFNQSRGRKNIQFIQCDIYKSPYWAKLPKAIGPENLTRVEVEKIYNLYNVIFTNHHIGPSYQRPMWCF